MLDRKVHGSFDEVDGRLDLLGDFLEVVVHFIDGSFDSNLLAADVESAETGGRRGGFNIVSERISSRVKIVNGKTTAEVDEEDGDQDGEEERKKVKDSRHYCG